MAQDNNRHPTKGTNDQEEIKVCIHFSGKYDWTKLSISINDEWKYKLKNETIQ